MNKMNSKFSTIEREFDSKNFESDFMTVWKDGRLVLQYILR
jgi:hypothetical protein